MKKSVVIPLQYDTGFSPFYASEFDEALEWLEINGFDGIEICISEPQKVNVKELIEKLERHKLEVSSISTGQARTLENIHLTHHDDDRRKAAVERILQHIDLSSKIGYPAVTIGLIRGLGSVGREKEELDLLAEGMKVCCEYAEKKNVKLMIEPINRYETVLLNSVDDTLNYISKKLGNYKCLGILYDTFHSNIEDKDMLKAIKDLGDRLFHVHVADSNRGLPGYGHTNFVSIYKALEEIRYKGYISIEVQNIPDREYIKNNAADSLRL